MGIEIAGGIFARSKLNFQHYFFEHFSTGATKRELRTENREPRSSRSFPDPSLFPFEPYARESAVELNGKWKCRTFLRLCALI